VEIRGIQDIHNEGKNVDKCGVPRIIGICEILFLFYRFIGRLPGQIQVKSSTFLQKERGEVFREREKLTDIGF